MSLDKNAKVKIKMGIRFYAGIGCFYYMIHGIVIIMPLVRLLFLE